MLKRLDTYLLPAWVQNSWNIHLQSSYTEEQLISEIKKGLQQFNVDQPVVSIVIPAWNEEKTIARTLYSLSRIKTDYPTELIIVNNNSTDRTQSILDACGVRSILETRKGIAYARQAGMEAARGTFVLSGDSDTLYPEGWVDLMMTELKKEDVAVVWGRHSFVPTPENTRLKFALYETIKQFLYRFRSAKRPYLNAMGANVGYKREYVMRIGGYDVTARRGSDGRLAMSLWQFGKIVGIRSSRAVVWTDARRFNNDSGLLHSLLRRARIEIPRIPEYLGLTKKDLSILGGYKMSTEQLLQE